jgi:hypothetical protein
MLEKRQLAEIGENRKMISITRTEVTSVNMHDANNQFCRQPVI